MKKQKKKRLNKLLIYVIILIVVIISIPIILNNIKTKEIFGDSENIAKEVDNINYEKENTVTISMLESEEKKIDDWNLVLVNSKNKIPDDYTFELSDIDSTRKFDSRAIKYLNELKNAAINAGHSDLWVQSSYRTIEIQKSLFDNKVKYYKSFGYSDSEAESKAGEYVNKPGYSEHNIGLCVDFNYVTESFADTAVFKWLCANAEDYGFILRYKKEKQSITGVSYEPWHWRYVGKEHAKKMNELDMCLEEYIEYLRRGVS